ncbi:MAG: DUF4395 domain-containing protein [Anaerolineae bacterium]|nr:DUF4395 domain-containing protein [Anaerolineales bacterium]MCQ3975698.1 DUF4395 domain-containing protein [Anaerolineae bacterium]
MNQQILSQVDHTAIKVSQTMTMLLLVTAFVLDNWLLVAFVAGVNILGSVLPSLSLFGLVYRHLLKPSGLVKPHVVPDYPEPHRFAQGFSGVVTALSAWLVWGDVNALGWALSWLVIILANLNVFACFCAGCFTYYQLHRLGVPGFHRSPRRA